MNNKGSFFPGFVTGEGSIEIFAKKLEARGRIAPKPAIVTLVDQRKHPDKATEAIEASSEGFFHSLGELAINESWPERRAFIINPPTLKTAPELVVGGLAVLKNVIKGAVEGTEDKRYRKLLRDSLSETVGHPWTTVAMGLRGINYDAVERLADFYSSLSPSQRPAVHVIVSDREPMFTYDEPFETKVNKAGFTLHRIDCGHNSLYTKPERVLEVIEHELDQL